MGHNHVTRDIRPEGSGCNACDAYHRSQREGAHATPLPVQTMESYLAWLENTPLDQLPPGEAPGQRGGEPTIEELIEASSLGTPEAKAMRAEGRRLLMEGRRVWLVERVYDGIADTLGVFSTPEKARKVCQDEANAFFGESSTRPLDWSGGDDEHSSAPYHHPVSGMWMFSVTRYAIDEPNQI